MASKKGLNIPKRQSEAVNRRRTDTTIAKRTRIACGGQVCNRIDTK